MSVRVGIVGAGPWAERFHAPTFAEGPETELAGIWSRDVDAADALAAKFGSRGAGSFEELLDTSDAIVFNVPPNVQAELAPRAAVAGKPLLLEKPLGLNLDQAQRIADAIAEHGTVNQVMLSNRYSDTLPSFLDEASSRTPIGAIATFVNDACVPGGMFATPWRIEIGAILDLGPHVLDILDAALGPIVDIRADGDPRRFVTVTSHHENGTVSQAGLSLTATVDVDVAYMRLFTEEGEMAYEFFTGANPAPEIPGNLRAQFAQTVISGRSHEINVERVLYLQKLIDSAMQSLDR